jgi:hypothetical protein
VNENGSSQLVEGFDCSVSCGLCPTGLGQKPAKGAVNVEDLQKNWKTLLADGADVAPNMEPLKLADGEWKKKLARGL